MLQHLPPARRKFLAAFAAVGVSTAAFLAANGGVAAAENVKVGKAVGTSWSFTVADVGVGIGVWKKRNIDVEILSFAGDARLNQAMVSDTIDIGLAGGTNIAFIAKGAPIRAVAALLNQPDFMGITVSSRSPIKSVEDLRGKKVAVTNPSSLTYFLVRELSRQQGWGSDGITPVPLGAPPAMFAALKAGQVDALVSSAEGGYAIEKAGDGRVITTYGGMLPDYCSLIIFATEQMISKRPQVLRDFLAGWFETVAWMRSNKPKSIEIANSVIKLPPDVAEKTFDRVMPTYSIDGRFGQKAFQKLVDSTRDLGLADPTDKLDFATLHTEQYLPPK